METIFYAATAMIMSLSMLFCILLVIVAVLRKVREKARREAAYWRMRLEWACQAPDFIEPTYCECGQPIAHGQRHCKYCHQRYILRERLLQEELSA